MPEPTTFDLPCPHCGAILEAELCHLGIEATCGSCRGEITVYRSPLPSPPRFRRELRKSLDVGVHVLKSVSRQLAKGVVSIVKAIYLHIAKANDGFPPLTASCIDWPEDREVVTRELMLELEWKSFEKLVEEYFLCTEVRPRLTRVGPDGGVDLELFGRRTGKLKAIVQCKAWKAYRVGVKPVRELYGVMAARGVCDGYFFTTGEFTNEAQDFARNTGLRLVTGEEFLNRIEALPQQEQQTICRRITEGDYSVPTCPSCDIKMVERTAKRGKNEGETFWGCPRYPNCHQTFRK